MGRRPRDQAARGRRRSDDVPTQASTKTAAHKRYLEHHRGPGTKEPAAYVNNLSGRRPGIISPRSSTWRPRDQGARGHRRGGHGTKEPGHRRGESASSPDAGTSDIFKPPTLPDWGTGHGGIRDDVPTQASAEPRRISEARSESPTARSLRNAIGGHVKELPEREDSTISEDEHQPIERRRSMHDTPSGVLWMSDSSIPDVSLV